MILRADVCGVNGSRGGIRWRWRVTLRRCTTLIGYHAAPEPTTGRGVARSAGLDVFDAHQASSGRTRRADVGWYHGRSERDRALAVPLSVRLSLVRVSRRTDQPGNVDKRPPRHPGNV